MFRKSLLIFFTLFVLLFVGGCGGGNGNRTLSVDGVIGKYISIDVISMFGKNFNKYLGGGLYIKNGLLQGWPQAVGVFDIVVLDTAVNVNIKPYYSEIINGVKGDKIAISWDTPQSSRVVYIDESGAIKNLSDNNSGFQWQLSSDTTLDNIVFINFVKDKGNDQVVYMDRVGGRVKVFEDENVMHRKPIYKSGFIYWYWDKVDNSNNRTVGISKTRSIDYSDVVILDSSNYPNVIYDYSVMDEGVVAVAKKNYDQQRSDLLFYSESRNITLHFDEDSFIQNLMHDESSNKLYFEIKRHGGLWSVKSCDVGCRIFEKIESVGANVLLVSNNSFLIKTIRFNNPMPVGDIVDILLRRYSPPILGLSHYDNRFGVLSITEAPVMRSLVNIAEYTGDLGYWYSIAERVKVILRRTDESLLLRDFSNKSGPHWSVKFFSNGVNNPFLVHDASILDVMMLLARKMTNDPTFSSMYPGMLSQIMSLFKLNHEWHAANLVTSANDRFGIIKEDEAYFVFHPGSTFDYDGVNLPFNMMNSYVRPLLIYGELSGDEYFGRLACSLGKVFKRHLVYNADYDYYIWPYWWGMYDKGWDGGVSVNTPTFMPKGGVEITDVDHASLDIRAVGSFYERQLLFTTLDVSRFSNTMARVLRDDDYKSPLLIDGKIRSANYNSIEYLWGEMIGFSPFAREVYSDKLRVLPYVQDAYTPTARFELVGLTQLLNVKKNADPNFTASKIKCDI